MEISSLQFRNPRLVNFKFVVNNDFENFPNQSINIDINFSKNIEMQDGNEAVVQLTIKVGKEDPGSPFYIEATEGALFTWNDAEDSMVDLFLNQNAPAVLLGYLRPIVSMITAASPYPAYDLPLINFRD